MYAFLPREAVTRFLMSCKDCQKRMHLQMNHVKQKQTLDVNATLKQLSERYAENFMSKYEINIIK